jgi:hypothetical protein
MSPALPSNAPPAKPHWTLNLVIVLGICWAINYLVPALSRGITAPLEWLPLLGFASPLLRTPGNRWFKICAIALCVIQVLVSGVMFFASFINYMDPIGFRVRVLGVPVTTIWNTFGQSIYLMGRAGLFVFAGLVIAKRCEQEMA